MLNFVYSFRIKGTGRYLKPEEVNHENNVEKATGLPLVVEWEKMSKSKYNGVDPNEILERYGCDTTRLMILCDGSPRSDNNWSEESYLRIRNIQVNCFHKSVLKLLFY